LINNLGEGTPIFFNDRIENRYAKLNANLGEGTPNFFNDRIENRYAKLNKPDIAKSEKV
jgi:hypothetical protein